MSPVGERWQVDHRFPAGPALQQLRSRSANDEQRHVGPRGSERLDEVEQAVVRPVHVLERKHERALGRQAGDEAPPGREDGRAPE